MHGVVELLVVSFIFLHAGVPNSVLAVHVDRPNVVALTRKNVQVVGCIVRMGIIIFYNLRATIVTCQDIWVQFS